MHGPLNVKLLHTLQTDPETHPACCTMDIGLDIWLAVHHSITFLLLST